ncbi:MAG: hypothetical protein R3F34_05065 [Planctomycetota bacterium]
MKLSFVGLYRVVVVGGLTAVGGFFGYRMVEADIAVDVYKRRLEEVATKYESLRQSYNQAVRRSAVTELLVHDGKLDIAVRGGDGGRSVLETKLDPSQEIYVDYVLYDGRLLIRRVFDSWTAPKDAIVLDSALVDVDWDDPRAEHGKAVYRALSDGRWIISVSGSGSLGLVRLGAIDETVPSDLVRAPEVKNYAEILTETEAELHRIGVGDVGLGDRVSGHLRSPVPTSGTDLVLDSAAHAPTRCGR